MGFGMGFGTGFDTGFGMGFDTVFGTGTVLPKAGLFNEYKMHNKHKTNTKQA